MIRLFETLESRTLFSTTVSLSPFHPVVQSAAVHVSATKAAPVLYLGTAINSATGTSAHVQMSITSTAKGDCGEFQTTDPITGKALSFVVKMDSSGNFSASIKSSGGTIALSGMVSSDQQTVTANWSETPKKSKHAAAAVSSTISLSRISAPASNNGSTGNSGAKTGDHGKNASTTPSSTPTPTPSPTPTNPGLGGATYVITYTGTSTDQNGMQMPASFDVYKAPNDVVLGLVKFDHPDGTVDSFLVTYSSVNFTGGGTDAAGNTVSIHGSVASDSRSINATWKSVSPNGNTLSGAFTVSLPAKNSPTPTPTPTPTPNPTPTPTPAPTPTPTPAPTPTPPTFTTPAQAHYVGTATITSTGQQLAITMDLYAASNGTSYGLFMLTNSDGSTQTVYESINSTGRFNGGATSSTPFVVGGYVSADGSTVSGSWMVKSSSGTSDMGAFSLTRS